MTIRNWPHGAFNRVLVAGQLASPMSAMNRVLLVTTTFGLLATTVGCRSDGASVAELVGTYVYREATIGSTHAPESLVINADGSFVQYYGSRDYTEAETNSGTWVLPSNPRNRGDIYLHNLKRWEHDDPRPLAAGEITNFKAVVEKSGTRVFIVLSYDTGKEFVKGR
jgi:hypothetical protein